MRRVPVVLSSLILACTSEPATSGEAGMTGVPEIPPMSGRWLGTSGSGDTVDLTMIEIQNQLGGQGIVLQGADTVAVGVMGRHDDRSVALRVTGPGRAWTFEGNLTDRRAREMIGRWSTFAGTTGLTLFKCAADAACP